MLETETRLRTDPLPPGDDLLPPRLDQHVPLEEAWVGLAVGETGPAHSYVLQQAPVLHLVTAALLLKQQGGLDLVRLDAADVVGLLNTRGRWLENVSATV